MDDAGADEAARLREVYARRDETGESLPLGRYSLLNSANLYLIQRLERSILTMLRGESVVSFQALRILDVGCGTGQWLRRFAVYGASPDKMAGIDLRPGALHDARQLAPNIDFRDGDARALPWADGSFDLVTQFTVLSSVLSAEARRQIAAEMRRVLAPGGLILWYDMTVNPTNRDVVGLGKNDVRALFPGCRIRFHRETLAPPLGRLVAPRSWTAARLLEALPFLRTHLLAVIRPPALQDEQHPPSRLPTGAQQ